MSRGCSHLNDLNLFVVAYVDSGKCGAAHLLAVTNLGDFRDVTVHGFLIGHSQPLSFIGLRLSLKDGIPGFPT